MDKKQTILSGIAPSGNLHIGNYLGALKQWVDLQKDYQVFAMVADLHAITVPQDPKELHAKSLEVAKIMVACGIDPEKSVVFLQSHVPAHAELGWILNTMAPIGELERMTQFKEKTRIRFENIDIIKSTEQLVDKLKKILTTKHISGVQEAQKEILNLYSHYFGERREALAGLLNYPWLMTADILLYNTDLVPVGEDQEQHLELTRTLARKFNNKFGDTFKEPKPFILKETTRIMGLDDPAKKMSKSAPSEANYIGLLDFPDTIRKKIKSAVTDSGSEIKYDSNLKPAISNLISIYGAFADKPFTMIEKDYSGKPYADFKNGLAELLVEKLSPIQKRYQELSDDDIEGILRNGAEKAKEVANKTLRDVKEKMGFIL